jgi:hypothetical protein
MKAYTLALLHCSADNLLLLPFLKSSFLLKSSFNREVMRIGVTNFNNSKNNGTLLIDLQPNDKISLICTQATMQLIRASIPLNIFAGYLLG